jgi:hypothetical protein
MLIKLTLGGEQSEEEGVECNFGGSNSIAGYSMSGYKVSDHTNEK